MNSPKTSDENGSELFDEATHFPAGPTVTLSDCAGYKVGQGPKGNPDARTVAAWPRPGARGDADPLALDGFAVALLAIGSEPARLARIATPLGERLTDPTPVAQAAPASRYSAVDARKSTSFGPISSRSVEQTGESACGGQSASQEEKSATPAPYGGLTP
jgi:hypothetical protein